MHGGSSQRRGGPFVPVNKSVDTVGSRQSSPSTGSGRTGRGVASGSIVGPLQVLASVVDKHALPTCWIQCVTPDPRLPSNQTPFRLLLGRDARTQLDSIMPVIDGAEYRGLDAFVADKQQTFTEVRKAIDERQTAEDLSGKSHNDSIGLASQEGQAKVGDNVSVKVAGALDGTMAGRAVHPGLSYAAHLNVCSIREKMVSAVDIKTFHERPVELRHAFEDEFPHLAWRSDVGLVETSTAAAPLYTLIDSKVSWVTGDTWVWEYKGRYQTGSSLTG